MAATFSVTGDLRTRDGGKSFVMNNDWLAETLTGA